LRGRNEDDDVSSLHDEKIGGKTKHDISRRKLGQDVRRNLTSSLGHKERKQVSKRTKQQGNTRPWRARGNSEEEKLKKKEGIKPTEHHNWGGGGEGGAALFQMTRPHTFAMVKKFASQRTKDLLAEELPGFDRGKGHGSVEGKSSLPLTTIQPVKPVQHRACLEPGHSPEREESPPGREGWGRRTQSTNWRCGQLLGPGMERDSIVHPATTFPESVRMSKNR